MGKRALGKGPQVVSRHGRYRFRLGMVASTVLQLGFDMDAALEAATTLRERLSGRDEVLTCELEDALYELLEELHGFVRPPIPAPKPTPKQIRGDLGTFPFSRGLLVRRIVATGVSVHDSLKIADAVASEVERRPERELPQHNVDAIAEDLLRRHHGAGFARRYRVTTRIRHLERPVLILVGGAAGTGKSSLATELAYRLGVRKVTSTDMIRETMRTVLSSDLLPGLHDHSFRGIIQGRQVLSDPRERVLAGFRQQAAQVAVGVRGVIRRALRERTHMIIEGTHLLPPFSSLVSSDADLHVAGFVLSVQSRAAHRARFPARARLQPHRGASAYLDAFQSVRWIHDDILRLVEDHSAYVIENTDLPQSVAASVEYLSRVIPFDEQRISVPDVRTRRKESDWVRTLMLVMDGLADEPIPALDDKTPLAAADTPTLYRLAGAGAQGMLNPTPPGQVAHTDVGIMTLFWEDGERPKLGRGVLEALGAGVPLHANCVLLRGNMATVTDAGLVLDRRAGRIDTGVPDLIAGLRELRLPGGITGHVSPGLEHRVVIALNGPGLSSAVTDSDPGSDAVQTVRPIQPLDNSPEAARTAEALEHLLELARAHLRAHPHNADRVARGLQPANAIITRGAGSVGHLTKVRPLRPAAVLAACPAVLGVGRAAGMTPVSSVTTASNPTSDLDQRFAPIDGLFVDHELVVVHLKDTDVLAHDRKPLEKRDFIAAADAALGRLLERTYQAGLDLRVVVTADHGTSSLSGKHLPDPVPLLISRWDPQAEQADFDEASTAQGELGLIEAEEFTKLLWSSNARDPLGR